MRLAGRVATLGVILATGLACGAASSEPGPGESGEPVAEPSGDQAPPPPAPVPGNRCRARALLVEVRPLSTDERPSGLLSEAGERPLQSLTLEIESSREATADRADLCVPGERVRAFGVRQQLDDVVGRTVDVELELLGDSDQRHWWLHVLEPPPDETDVERRRP